MFRKLISTEPSKGNILIRLMVGGIFFTEGLLKLMYPALLGAGRFAHIGIPNPAFFGPFVGYVETVFGFLVAVGFATRIAAIPLLIDIMTALYATKLPILLQQGVLAVIHEARTDLSMFLGLIFLLISGGGLWSLDDRMTKRWKQEAK